MRDAKTRRWRSSSRSSQLYRERGGYLERIYKWTKRTGIDADPAPLVVDDLEGPKALFDRFVHSQIAQIDPWAERAQGKDANEFRPWPTSPGEAAQ